jgi:hypothetical protein
MSLAVGTLMVLAGAVLYAQALWGSGRQYIRSVVW